MRKIYESSLPRGLSGRGIMDIPLAAQPLDLGWSSVTQAEEPAIHTR
jgi:hypothetical protein